MNFELPIGARGNIAEFQKIFTIDFLTEDNLTFYSSTFGGAGVISALTKYGEVIVHKNDVLTYLGNGIWDVRREKKDE